VVAGYGAVQWCSSGAALLAASGYGDPPLVVSSGGPSSILIGSSVGDAVGTGLARRVAFARTFGFVRVFAFGFARALAFDFDFVFGLDRDFVLFFALMVSPSLLS
jgi:hypothetical protein